jgi:outer membrane protein OmpU
MKNILLATTALVLSAGVAAAEVAVSGDARMGVVYDGDEMNFSSRARVKFTLSGETDGGLGFGASFRADQAGDSSSSNGAAYGSEGSVYVSGAFGKVEMGDTVSAPEALLGDLPEIGFSDLSMDINNTVISGAGYDSIGNDIPYLTGDSSGISNITAASNPVLLYTYTMDAISLAASFSDGSDSDASTDDDDQEYALAASYNFGAYAVGLGYEVVDFGAEGKAKMLEIGGTATFGDTSVKGFYGQGDDLIDDVMVYGLGVESVFGATTAKGYVQVVDASDILGGDKITAFGLGAEYDLGGGAKVAGGVMDTDEAGTDAVYDLGLKFSF